MGNSFLGGNPAGALGGLGRFIGIGPLLFQDKERASWQEVVSAHSLHPHQRQGFCLPCATRRPGAGWGRLSALHVPNGPDLLPAGTGDLGGVLGSA